MCQLSLCLSVCREKVTLLSRKKKAKFGQQKMAAGERRVVDSDRTGAGLDVRLLSMAHRANKSGK